MGCGEFLVKYILFFANLFFALAGLALLGIGIAVELKVAAVVNFMEQNQMLQMTSISAIVLGSVVFVIAFFGCCGAVRESNCMLVTYSIFMLVLMVLKITLAVLIFVNLDSFLAEVPKWLNEAFAKDQQAFHELEQSLKCCGPTGASSYQNLVLPQSCCASTPCTIVNAYTSCNDVIQSFFSTFGLVTGAVAIGIVAVELVAVVFGLCLANHVRNRDRRAYY
ncbi:tetraspanin-18-like [Aricia agestis]|uniref:tetraspanin-18-like n=1 Tax=Aricia agestis TaxID=91739 RepID=UPI001C206C8F|nr:tetraspanin-18-like [Aricia agestis]